MAREPTKWEPSAASIENMLRATAKEQGYKFDEIPLGEIEEARCVAPIAIKAAVAADPLLSAAADMRDALDQLADLAAAFSVSGVYFSEPCFADNVKALQDAYAALAKAKGE